MTNTKSIYTSPEGEKAIMALYDSLLARWPVPYETLNISTQFGNTFVIASGDEGSPPLILLHGAGTNSGIWAGDVAEYSRHYRVYAVDLLGEAGRSAPNRPNWKGSAYAEWFDDVLDALQIDTATLIGISQGGWTALKFAVYKPERVEKLILICPGGVLPDRLSFVLRAVLFTLTGGWGIRQMVHMLYGAQSVPDGAEEIIAVMMRSFNSRVGLLPIFSDEELPRLTMPTLLLGGSQDALRDMGKIATRMRNLLPNLAVNVIPGAGHALLNTTRFILPFLADKHWQKQQAVTVDSSSND